MTWPALEVALRRQFKPRLFSIRSLVSALLPAIIIGALIAATGEAIPPAAMLFLLVVSALWSGGSPCIREIVDERPLLERDRDISITAYWVAKLAYAVVLALLQSAILTWVGTASSQIKLDHLPLWGFLAATVLAGSLLAYLLSALVNDPATALRFFPILLIPQVLFAGLLFPLVLRGLPNEPPLPSNTLIRIGGNFSVSRWSLEGLAALALRGDLSGDRATAALRLATALGVGEFDEPAAPSLIRYNAARSSTPTLPPPHFPDVTGHYAYVLTAFIAVKSGLLLAILWLRDPRPR